MEKDGRGHRQSASMRQMLLLMMIGLVTATIVTFVFLILSMHLIPSLNDSAYRSMYNQSSAQASRVGTELEGIMRSTLRTNTSLTREMNAVLKEGQMSLSQLANDQEALEEFLSVAYDALIDLIDEQPLSGAFVILDCEYGNNRQNGHVSLYLRNSKPAISSATSSSITLLQGPTRVPQLQNLALDQNWTYGCMISEELDTRYYDKPVQAAKTYTKASVSDLSFWSSRFRHSSFDVEIITYTIPLVGEDGEVYGVCGAEISLTLLAQLMPFGDIPYEDGFYLLGQFVDDQMLGHTMVSNDLNGDVFLSDVEERLHVEKAAESGTAYKIYSLRGSQGVDMLASIVNAGLYTRNSPFYREQYHLYVVAPRAQVLSKSLSITLNILVTLVVSAALSVVGAVLLSRFFARRIEKLATEAAALNPEKPVSLPRTNIHELDLLSDVLEQMNANVAAHAARMSTIVDSVGMPMGAFEIEFLKERAFLTDSMFRLLRLPHGEEDSQYLPIADFMTLLPQIDLPEEEGESVDFPWSPPAARAESSGCWFRLTRMRNNDFLYGTVLDITEEVKEKERLEYERNYDPLTKLLNRNAYSEMMTCLIRKMPEKMGLLLFGDLDNLKTVNDTFGHDTGDRYIQLAADALSMFNREGGVAARISGDEFTAYLHGGDSREELRRKADNLLAQMRERQMMMPDGTVQKVRISVGIAFYPDDADNIPELIRYADFAMYEIKHSFKGGTNEFNRESYERNSHLLDRPNQVDFLLDRSRSRFAFQPIVDLHSCGILGYEALMRPQTREMYSPTQAISLAKSQSKLPQLEKVTVLGLMDWARDNAELSGFMLFFNSMPSLLPNDGDFEEILERMEQVGGNLVMEITEEEQKNPAILSRKVERIRRAKVQIALDNFGSDDSNFSNLFQIMPDYLKIDMQVIRGIDRDTGRQMLLKSIVSHANANKFKVIAEGVETYEELQTVAEAGVHYAQGFYLARPEYQLAKELPAALIKKLRDVARQCSDLSDPPEQHNA